MQTRFLTWFAVVMSAVCLGGCQLTNPPEKQRSVDELLLETIDVAAKEQKTKLSLAFQEPHFTDIDEIAVRQVQYEASEPDLGGPKVNGVFEEEDVRLTLQLLAEQAEVPIIVDEQVAGSVNAMITDQPFESALQAVLLPLGYIWKFHEGSYLIGSADPSSSLFRYLSEKIDYKPSHFAPGELLPLLQEDLQQYVRLIEKRNLMVIQAPSELAQEILEELRRADQPVPQVVLEAIVAVHSPESSYKFGFDLRQVVDQAALAGVNIDLSALAFSGTVQLGSLGQLFRNFAQTSYFLRCLEQNGYIDIRASPRVMARDGEKAQISINRETFFSTQPQNSDVFFRQDIQKVESGIILDITPVIRGDTITVTIERAEVSEDIRESGSDPDLARPFPLINRRFVTTTVDVKDGETITIAGLTHHQMVDRVNSVPGVSKIPLIGKMFRQIDKQQTESDVTVFISPRIVYPHSTEAVMGGPATYPPLGIEQAHE